MKKKIALAMAGLLTSSFMLASAQAAKPTLMLDNLTEFSKGSSYVNTYKVSREALANSPASFTAAIKIGVNDNITVGKVADLVVSGYDGIEFSLGQSPWKYGLIDNNSNNLVASGNLLSGNQRISFTFKDNVTAPATLTLIRWYDNNSDDNYTSDETRFNNASFYMPQRSIDCSDTGANALLQFTVTDMEGSDKYNFVKINPQFQFKSFNNDSNKYDLQSNISNNFSAELDADKDFKVFKSNSSPDNDTYEEAKFAKVDDLSSSSPSLWVHKLSSLTGNYTYKVYSSSLQDGYTNLTQYNDQSCSTSDNKTWTCAGSGNLITDYGLKIFVGAKRNTPALWEAQFTQMSPQVCGFYKEKFTIGVWSGWLEAIVPIFRNGNGYTTTLALFNRYDKDVKVYAKLMLGSSDSIITPSAGDAPIITIPAKSRKTLKGSDVVSYFSSTGIDISSATGEVGSPLKLFFEAPSAGKDKDPYIEGLVVYTDPSGQQRSVPLKFRIGKHGEYNQ